MSKSNISYILFLAGIGVVLLVGFFLRDTSYTDRQQISSKKTPNDIFELPVSDNYYGPQIVVSPEEFNDKELLKFISDQHKQVHYTRDEENVYFQGNKIEGADADTFQILGEYEAKDANSIYLRGKKIFPEVDVDTFEVLLGGCLYRDKNGVYSETFVKQDVANLLSFRIYEKQYAVDDQFLYAIKRGLQKNGTCHLEKQALPQFL